MGKPFLDFLDEGARGAVEEVLMQGVRGEETANYELRLKAKTGKELYLLLNATARRDLSGRVTGVIGIAQDITEAKERESEIDRLLREANQLIETANAPIFGVDTDLRITEWNLKAQAISEYSKEETMGKPFLDFLDEGARGAVEEVAGSASRFGFVSGVWFSI